MASSECAASSEEPPPLTGEPTQPGTVTPLRLVLVGKTGSGRSSSGNTILGRHAFRVEASPHSITSQCERQIGTIDGRSVSVVDTPGFFDTRLSPKEVTKEVGQCVALSSPGPHAFLVTLQPGRITQEELDALAWVKAIFGAEVSRFTMVLFTWGDHLKGKCIEDFLRESDELSNFIGSCKGGYHIFDNSGSSSGWEEKTAEVSQQVVELLEKVDKMVAENGNGHYTHEMLREAARAIQEVQERILDDRVEGVVSIQREGQGLEMRREEEMTKQGAEVATKNAEKVFWCELLTALGKGAAEGAGVLGKDKSKPVKKAKVVKKAAAFATSPISVTSAAKVLSGAVREGSKVVYKHRKTLLH